MRFWTDRRLVCIVLGLVLFMHGAQGTTSWTARLPAATDVTDAPPGIVFCLVGLLSFSSGATDS